MESKEEKILISLVIVNYNGKEFTKDCIDSILKSSYENFEVILIDNASTDGSCAFFKKEYRNNLKVKIIRSKEQLYFTGGCNLGVQEAEGKKIIFLNNDTTVDREFIEKLVEFSKGKKKYIVQPKIIKYQSKDIIDSAGGIYVFPGFGLSRGNGKKDSSEYNKRRKIDYTTGTCLMIDKAFFINLGGFDEWYKYYYEDVDLCLRARKQGGQCWYYPKSIIYHKGSLTFKKYVANKDLTFNIRKNILMTVIKNFSGAKRIFRLISLLPIYLTTPASFLAVFNQKIKFMIEKFRVREIKKIAKKKHFSLLDLGCGDGGFINFCLENNIDAVGIDKSPKTSNFKIISSSIESFQSDKKFDIVTLFHVIEHLNSPSKTLKKVKDLLKTNGFLVIETPLIGNLTEKFLEKKYLAYHDKSHINLFTKKELLNLIEDFGFEIKKIGTTWYEFPFSVITTSFQKGFVAGLIGILLFLPFKFLSFLHVNDEIIRIYCQRNSQEE